MDGFGDAQGYHLQVSRGSAGYAWQEIAVLHPADMDVPSWTGYQCVSGDGAFAAVAILPTTQVNDAASRDHGAFAYSVELASGVVRPIAAGVGLKYYSPGCGAGDDAVFTTMLGTDQASTVLSTADLATGAVSSSVTVTGQVTSAVPTGSGPVGVLGSALVAIDPAGTPSVVATVPGDAYQLRPDAGGGLNFLSTEPGADTATVHHEAGGVVTDLGTGPRIRLQLFGGRAGGAVLSGAESFDGDAASGAGVTVVPDNGLTVGASAASLDGGLLVGADSDSDAAALVQLQPGSGSTTPVTRDTTTAATDSPDAAAAGQGSAAVDQSGSATQDPAGPAPTAATGAAGGGPAPVTDVPSFVPPGVGGQPSVQASPESGLNPAGDVKPAGLRSASGRAITPVPASLTGSDTAGVDPAETAEGIRGAQTALAQAAVTPIQANAPPAATTASFVQAAAASAQSPTCAVPRGDLNKQVMQPSPAQVDWAAQMAEQGLLTGSTYTRPAGFANMGFPAYAPSTDFPPTALAHPAGSSTTTVPRVVFEAIMAQESNFSQASWHAPAGTPATR